MPVAVVVLSLVLAACASSGTNFREDQLARLEPGVTTESEAIKILGGRPYQRVNNSDGSSLLVWSHAVARIGSVRSKAVSILFDASGTMVRIHKGVNVRLPQTPGPSGRVVGILCGRQLPSGDFLPIITTVQAGGLAAVAGWLPGDTVLSIDGQAIRTMTDFILATQAGGPRKVYVLRREEAVFESVINFDAAN